MKLSLSLSMGEGGGGEASCHHGNINAIAETTILDSYSVFTHTLRRGHVGGGGGGGGVRGVMGGDGGSFTI